MRGNVEIKGAFPPDIEIHTFGRNHKSLPKILDYWSAWSKFRGRLEKGTAVISFMGHSSLLGNVISSIVRPKKGMVVFAGTDVELISRRAIRSIKDVIAYTHIKLGTSLWRQAIIIGITKKMELELKRTFRDREVRYIPVGIEETFFSDRKYTSGERRVLFVGRLERVKGIEYLIDAFRMICKKHDDVVLEIAGDGSLSTFLRKTVFSDPIIRNRVRFLGRIPHEHIHKLMKKSTFLVLPSLSEGLPLTVLEAMASGLPVIASRVGGIPEIVVDGHNGLLVPPRSVERLAFAMDRLLSNPSLIIELGRRAREVAEKYRISKVTDAYERLINYTT